MQGIKWELGTNKHPGLLKGIWLSQGRAGWKLDVFLGRNTAIQKSFHQPLMDLLIFSGQHGLTLAMDYNNLFKKELASINGLFHQCLDFPSHKCICLLNRHLLYAVRAQLWILTTKETIKVTKLGNYCLFSILFDNQVLDRKQGNNVRWVIFTVLQQQL